MPVTHHILIVEDDPDQRALYQLVLTNAGYRTDAVADAATALAYLDACEVDLVLTDLAMPNIPGDELIRTLKARHAHLRTILMSNHDDIHIAAHAVKADAWIHKQMAFPQWLALIAASLAL